MVSLPAFIREATQHNISTFKRQPLLEISGAVADLGTFLPILVSLAGQHQISLSTTLVFTGLSNVVTGFCFGIPLPVQPMKAIAAIAIAENLTQGDVMAAGIFVSGVIFLLSVTGLLEMVNEWTPVPVVKGIQVGAGLSLLIAAGNKAVQQLHWTGPSWADNRLWLLGVFAVFLTLQIHSMRRFPFSLFFTCLGIAFAIARSETLPTLGVWRPQASAPSKAEWITGIMQAGIGQLPLTTLNSVIAVVALANDMLPSLAPGVTQVGMSVAAMNLVGCWFGSMPTCHGSGGLAAQYRFGARSGSSILFLGLIKLILGLVFGNSLAELLDQFPISLLTIMVIAAGLELASVGESLNDIHRARDLVKHENRGDVSLAEGQGKERWTVMMTTAGMLLAFKNDAVGFLSGLACHYVFYLSHRLERDQSSTDDEERRGLLAS